jgi:tRNA(fMet)-specific endonuclease VapC
LPQATSLNIAVEEFLLRVDVLAWDSSAAQRYAQLRAELERTGRAMGSFDTMIAAHALATDAILVTHDQGFRQFKQLKTEDWCKPAS